MWKWEIEKEMKETKCKRKTERDKVDGGCYSLQSKTRQNRYEEITEEKRVSDTEDICVKGKTACL